MAVTEYRIAKINLIQKNFRKEETKECIRRLVFMQNQEIVLSRLGV